MVFVFIGLGFAIGWKYGRFAVPHIVAITVFAGLWTALMRSVAPDSLSLFAMTFVAQAVGYVAAVSGKTGALKNQNLWITFKLLKLPR